MTPIMILDMVLVGFAVFKIIKGLVHDGKIGRLLAILGSILTSILYGVLIAWAFLNSVQPVPTFFIVFGPILIVLLVLLVGYVYGKDDIHTP